MRPIRPIRAVHQRVFGQRKRSSIRPLPSPIKAPLDLAKMIASGAEMRKEKRERAVRPFPISHFPFLFFSAKFCFSKYIANGTMGARYNPTAFGNPYQAVTRNELPFSQKAAGTSQPV